MDSCQLKECLEKALHMRVCFYMGVSSSVEELGKSRRNLEQMEQEAVPGNNGMLLKRNGIRRILPMYPRRGRYGKRKCRLRI